MSLDELLKEFDEKFTYGRPFVAEVRPNITAKEIKSFLTQALIEQRVEGLKERREWLEEIERVLLCNDNATTGVALALQRIEHFYSKLSKEEEIK